MMMLKDILRQKGTDVYCISSNVTLADAIDQLVEHNVGSLLVRDGDQITGIITERDILRACRTKAAQLNEVLVAEVMTKDVITAKPDDKVSDVMGWLTEKRIRHLPVIENGKLAGLISIGDVVKAQHDQLSVENHYLKSYIQS